MAHDLGIPAPPHRCRHCNGCNWTLAKLGVSMAEPPRHAIVLARWTCDLCSRSATVTERAQIEASSAELADEEREASAIRSIRMRWGRY